MGIQTILLCYIADEEMFPPEKRFADGSLQSAISKTAHAASSSKSSSSKIVPTDGDKITANNNDTSSRRDEPPLL